MRRSCRTTRWCVCAHPPPAVHDVDKNPPKLSSLSLSHTHTYAQVLAAVAHRLMAGGEHAAAAGSQLLTFYAVDLPRALQVSRRISRSEVVHECGRASEESEREWPGGGGGFPPRRRIKKTGDLITRRSVEAH
jgi:hypothetical protein